MLFIYKYFVLILIPHSSIWRNAYYRSNDCHTDVDSPNDYCNDEENIYDIYNEQLCERHNCI